MLTELMSQPNQTIQRTQDMGEGDDLQVPPTVKGLNGLVKREGDIPVSGGTYSDVWMGTCLGRKVALKALREVRTTAKKAVKVRSHENSM